MPAGRRQRAAFGLLRCAYCGDGTKVLRQPQHFRHDPLLVPEKVLLPGERPESFHQIRRGDAGDTVYVNGTQVGTHYNSGYTGFYFDISNYVLRAIPRLSPSIARSTTIRIFLRAAAVGTIPALLPISCCFPGSTATCTCYSRTAFIFRCAGSRLRPRDRRPARLCMRLPALKMKPHWRRTSRSRSRFLIRRAQT